jgi:hypothetical protein
VTELRRPQLPGGWRAVGILAGLATTAAMVACTSSATAPTSPANRPPARSSSPSAVATPTRPPLQSLVTVHARVTRQQPRLKVEGINIVTWGPDAKRNREQLTVQHLTAHKAAVLDAMFARNNIILHTTKAASAGCGCAATPKSPAPRLPVPKTTH